VDAGTRARSLHNVTGGHPFFVGEVLQNEDWAVAVPSTVREFVRGRVRSLGVAEEAALACASCLLIGFDAPLLAEIAEISEPLAVMYMHRAIQVGIVRQVDARLFVFAHELTRRALYDSIDGDALADIHRRIAMALETRDAPPAVLATHWQRAAGEDARAKAFACAARAAEDALRSLDPDTAAQWLERGIEAAASPDERASTLLRLADAQHQSGDPRAAETFRRAVSQARALGDANLLVSCALAWTPIWESMPLLDAPERIEVLEEALFLAIGEHDRSRLLARLATELLYTEQRDRARILADDALASARRCGIAAAPEVAMRYFHATWAPHTLSTRRALMDETLAALSRDDVLNRSFALSMVAAAAIESAEPTLAGAALDEMLELADSHDVAVLRLNATTTRSWRAALAGDLVGSGQLAVEALTMARNDRMARTGIALQLAYLAWHDGRFAELLPFIEQLDASMTGSVTKRVMIARALAALDEHDAAGAALDSLSRRDLDTLPKDMLWSSTLILAAEAALMLGRNAFGEWVRELLEPFRDLVAFANYVVAPIAYGAGVAAAAARHDDVDTLFAQALEVSNRLGAPVLRARTELAWNTAQAQPTDSAATAEP
jgi:hypothetical protein